MPTVNTRIKIARYIHGRKPGKRWCFAYHRDTSPDAGARDSIRFGGYLDSDFSLAAPGRWIWADNAAPSIRHRGWYTDPTDCAGDTIRGLVVRLPHGRMIAGWSMGKGMMSMVDTGTVYTDLVDAGLAADRLAQLAAEREWHYQESLLDLDTDEPDTDETDMRVALSA